MQVIRDEVWQKCLADATKMHRLSVTPHLHHEGVEEVDALMYVTVCNGE